MSTPYDGQILWIHWTGQSVGENSIAELATTVRTHSPNVGGIAVKACDGPSWQGQFDNKASMAVTSPQAIANWVRELSAQNLSTHLWCVVRGNDIVNEAKIIAEACNVPGVQSMILDVEDGAHYFGGQSAQTARELITRIRNAIPADFHLALNLDYRGTHPANIHINEWLPYVQSLHPMVYHWHFSMGTRKPRGYLDDAFAILRPYNKPIVPMLQAYEDPATKRGVPEDHITDAGNYSFESGAVGITFFRTGTAGPPEFRAVNRVQVPNQPVVLDPGDNVPIEIVSEPKQFRVVTPVLRVRSAPTLEPRTVIANQKLYIGEVIAVDANSRKEAEGYVWWQHQTGWSAEKPVDGSEVYLAEVSDDDNVVEGVPQPAFTFELLPVDLDVMGWFFYFGNTIYAFNNGSLPDHNYDGYSQWLHGGIDLGHPGGAVVRAGVHGTMMKPGGAFGPHRMDVKAGAYNIIYGHLQNPKHQDPGTPVTPDTVMGEVSFNMAHAHIEIRYTDPNTGITYIYNPLLFLDATIRDALIRRFPPVGSRGFYSSATWLRWLSPLDQPVIVLGGPVIGPHTV